MELWHQYKLKILTVVGGLILALISGGEDGALNFIKGQFLPSTTSTNIVSNCRATDGDTIRCGEERIRLIAIDAPEMPGHCRKGRTCAPGDPHASTRHLSEAMVGPLRINRLGEDHYGRTLATISSDLGDLSCLQLRKNHAVYKKQWDKNGTVAALCPADVLL